MMHWDDFISVLLVALCEIYSWVSLLALAAEACFLAPRQCLCLHIVSKHCICSGGGPRPGQADTWRVGCGTKLSHSLDECLMNSAEMATALVVACRRIALYTSPSRPRGVETPRELTFLHSSHSVALNDTPHRWP